MSFFLGGTAQYANATIDPQKIALAEVQFRAQASTFNRLLFSCREKCLLHQYADGELVTGERCCIDRCVSKYAKANVLVGNSMQEKRLNPYNSMPAYTKVKSIMDGN